MKNIKMERNNVMEKETNNPMFSMTKGVIIAYFITVTVFIIYGALLTYTEITEKNIQMVTMVTTVISVLVAGFISARGVSSKGLIYGMVSGVIYSLIMFMISICILPKIQLNSKIIMIIILSICSGGIGGIIGINMKKWK